MVVSLENKQNMKAQREKGEYSRRNKTGRTGMSGCWREKYIYICKMHVPGVRGEEERWENASGVT